MKVRIAKYLASCGIGSRRTCEQIIIAGEVSVNGEVITSPALNISPVIDKIEMNGERLFPTKKVYYLLNKPLGVTCSAADKHALKLIIDLVPSEEMVWPVGRLDRDTEGLIILTNDGDLTEKLTHPKYEKSKTYVARLDKALNKVEQNKLRGGIDLDDGFLKPDVFKEITEGKYEVSIHEGRNRLVRRIFEYFGRKVVSLVRTRLSFLDAEGLETGEYRCLTDQEIERLSNA
jgi:23S rRNA pseudouridine2605 synthase